MKQFYALFVAFSALFQLQAQTDQYLHLDRVDDFVELENASSLVANAPGLTMTGWFYTDAYAYGQGMMGIRGTNAGFYMIQLDNGKIECRFQNSAGTLYEYVAPTFTIVPETWQHFAWVYTGSKVQLYINGTLKGSKTASGKITSTTTSFSVGKSLLAGFNFLYGGRVDEVSLWKKGLTEAEIDSMMVNELKGDETDLVAYFKCNQGVPGGDNTSISKLKNELGGGSLDADLKNFAMNGPTSNFGGILNTGFQAITFPQLANKLTTDAPFSLNATATSGLPVVYEILSGPATVSGSLLTLTGQPGEVKVRATQPGDGTFEAADEIVSAFKVLDPQTFVPEIDARSPLAADVFVPSLTPIQIAAIVKIGFPELFSVQNVEFSFDGGPAIPASGVKNWGNEHYTSWWTPNSFGPHEMKITATNNFGAKAEKVVAFNVVQTVGDLEAVAATDVWLNSGKITETVEAELPCFLGAFSKITAVLEVKCPPGGCGPWDRVASVEAKTHDGRWLEIIRYITPYGVPCSHEMDATDFSSLLNGKIAFRINNSTLDNGFSFNLKFKYDAGTPAFKYSSVAALWNKSYPFGDPANLQPTEPLDVKFPATSDAAKVKLVSSGHGWGDNNSGNAAEFHDDTHRIDVNGGTATFAQHNWMTCNPNPDGCSPQNGTWYYARAGWCPGAIAPWFDYDFTPFVVGGEANLRYIFDEDYVDECHPNDPACVNGATCPDCKDGFNPHLIVACHLISFGNVPLDQAAVSGVDDAVFEPELAFSVFPNPSATGIFDLVLKEETTQKVEVEVFNALGQRVFFFSKKDGGSASMHQISLASQPSGVYFLNVKTEKGRAVRTLVRS